MSETTNQPQSSRIDTILAMLADGERRRVIAYLRDTPSATASLDSLTAALTTHTDLDEERARVHLRHNHLPKLAEADLISYDTDTKTIEYRGHPALESVLDALAAPGSTPRQ